MSQLSAVAGRVAGLVQSSVRRVRAWLAPAARPRRPEVRPAVECLEDRCQPSSAKFVTSLYQNVLGRTPSAKEVTNFVQSKLNERQLANLFLTSNEYYLKVIGSTYQTFFNRAPDSGGQNTWLTALSGGMPVEVFITAIVTSDEFSSRNGGNATGIVNGLYKTFYGRPADAGSSFWVAQLNANVSLGAVVANFVGGPEYLGKYVQNDFKQYLNRSADTAGAEALVAKLLYSNRDRISLHDLDYGILTSAEYLAKNS